MRKVPSGLEIHVGYWLRAVSNHVSHAFKLKVESHDVTVAEWVVLRMLFNEDAVHPSQLAETIGMTRGAISKLVERLSQKGLVACRAAGGDRRFQTVSLAPAGRTLVPTLATLADQNDQEFFGHLKKQEREALLTLLKAIVKKRGLASVPME